MTTRHRKLAILVLGTWVLASGLWGCGACRPAPHAVKAPDHPPSRIEAGRYWWGCRFKMVWPPDKDPDFTVDLLLAHAVIRPVLTEAAGRLAYWRFHRRAARDQAGHQFSFLFYSDPGTAGEIFRKIGESEPLDEALKAGIVEKVITDDPDRPARPGIQDTSDPHWSPELQRSWPSFIMGVSSLWLGLIDECLQEAPGDGRDIKGLLDRYRRADARVTSIWHDEGQHAFLHHLNALFGYQPLIIKKELSF